MDPQRLRDETAADHERVEQLIPLTDSGLTLRRYVALLSRYYGFVKGWEDYALAQAAQDVQPILRERCRGTLLLRDLAHFGVPAPTSFFHPDLSVFATRAALLGAMYVVEGSTLGGQYMARHVEQTLHLRHGEGNAYFVGYGRRTGSMWRKFQALLGALPDEEDDVVIDAARRMFADFESWFEGWMQLPVTSGAAAAMRTAKGAYA